MSTKGKIFFGIAFLLVIGLILVFWFSKKNTSSDITQTTSVNGLPVIHGKKPSSTTSTFDITTQNGTIPVDNIYTLPDAKSLDFDGINFKNSPYYHMEYYPKQQGFLIAITNQDIQKSREMAESDFMTILNISKDQACQLNVSLTVPPSIDKKASGGNYGLSFCPNGKAFPK